MTVTDKFWKNLRSRLRQVPVKKWKTNSKEESSNAKES